MTGTQPDALLRWIEDWPVFSLLRDAVCTQGPEGVVYELGALRVRGATPGRPKSEDLDLLGWRPPPWLASLYAVHGGVGPWRGARDRWGAGAILPWDEVVPLTRAVRFGEENVLFDPADHVLLARDGAGGGLVLSGRAEPTLRWFDGQRHRVSSSLTVRDGLGRAVAHWIQHSP